MRDVEPQTPSGGDGALAQAQARVREISARAFDAFIVHYGRSPRRVADRLAELGWFGRGGDRYNDSTVIGWRNGEYAPSAFVLIAAMLDIELSLDEIAYGSAGLRAEVDQLKSRVDEFEQVKRDVALLAGQFTRHVELDPEAATDVSRIGRRDLEPG